MTPEAISSSKLFKLCASMDAWTHGRIDSGALTSRFLSHFSFCRILELTQLFFVGLAGRYLNPVVPKWALLDPVNEPLEDSEGV